MRIFDLKASILVFILILLFCFILLIVKGSLLPQPLSFGGRPVLTIRIEKIGLKDASQFIDPYMSVYVKGTDNISTLVALTIRIEKIGLKDASQFIDPYISVYIKGTEYR